MILAGNGGGDKDRQPPRDENTPMIPADVRGNVRGEHSPEPALACCVSVG